MTGPLRIAGVERGAAARFSFDGRPVDAFEGESVAAALACANILTLRRCPGDGSARGAFCLMGVCQECVVEVAGRRTESCRLPVSNGLEVRSAG